MPIGRAVAGKATYKRYCIGCHGERGDGQGENAAYIDPKPRDFTAGLFKCRSTPTGSIPLDKDLYNSVGRGFYSSGMPSWIALTNQERADLVAYIKVLSPRLRDEKPDPPVAIPPETSVTEDSILQGKQLYTALSCWQCHGKEGHGDGPSAFSLRDSKDNPIKPYDFTASTRFKCGETNEDLFRDVMTGLDGTPMPSFADYLKPEQTWDLVHYLRTLQNSKKLKKKRNTTPFVAGQGFTGAKEGR